MGEGGGFSAIGEEAGDEDEGSGVGTAEDRLNIFRSRSLADLKAGCAGGEEGDVWIASGVGDDGVALLGGAPGGEARGLSFTTVSSRAADALTFFKPENCCLR